MDIRLKRAYEPAAPSDGYRVLIDRLWPRGVSRERAKLDEWERELAPSAELREWFSHDPSRFQKFRRRYIEELRGRRHRLTELRRRAREGTVTLVYSARDTEHNDAVVLASVLRRGLAEGQQAVTIVSVSPRGHAGVIPPLFLTRSRVFLKPGRAQPWATGYSSAVRRRGLSMRWPLAFLAIFAILFAPAGDERPSGSTRGAQEGVDPRVIAPTVREGIVAAGARLTIHHIRVTEQRASAEPGPLAVASAVAGLVLAWGTSLAAGVPSGSRARLVALRALVPRAPPALGSI